MSNLLLLYGLFATGAIALPFAVPKLHDKLLGNIQRDWINHELPFDRIMNDNQTISLKDTNKFFRIYKIEGVNYEAMQIGEQDSLCSQRAMLLRELHKLGVIARFYCIKSTEKINYPATYPTDILQKIGDIEAINYSDNFKLDWYFTIENKSMNRLQEANDKLLSLLNSHKISPVMRANRGDICPITNFLQYLLSGAITHNLKSLSDNINDNLLSVSLELKQDGLITTQQPNTEYARILTITNWQTTNGLFLINILKLPIHLEIIHIVAPFQNSVFLIDRKINEQNMKFVQNNKTTEEYTELLAGIKNGDVSLFSTNLMIIVKSSNLNEINQSLDKIARMCGDNSISYIIETIATPISLFSKMPYNNKMVRPLKIICDNIASIWALPANNLGRESSPWDSLPIRLFKTQLGSAYRFQLHVSDKPQSKGHYLVFAPTGSGKSVLMLYLLSGLAKIDGVQSFVFDSQNGCKFMIEAMGGLYQDYNKFQFNPLDVGEFSPENLNRINLSLMTLLGDLAITPEIEIEIANLLELVFDVAPPHRTLDNWLNQGLSPQSNMRSTLAKWLTGGVYGHVFNNPHDSFTNMIGNAPITGINMNEALDDPILGAPIIAHISNIISKSAKSAGRGACIFIDEGGKQITNAGFCAFLKVAFQEYRKLDIAVGMAFQQPASLLNSTIKNEVLNNTSTFIFFKDSNANSDDYRQFGLNDEQISFIKAPGEGGKRQILIIQRDDAVGLNESVILDVDISKLGNGIMKYFRSGTKANDDIDNLKSQHGDNWRKFL